MQKLSFQDAFFLRAESSSCPFHVAALMVFKIPDDAPRNYLRELAEQFGQIGEVWPVFTRKLADPSNLKNPHWVEADDYDYTDHVLHYRLPKFGKMNDLLSLIAHSHEQVLDRTRPLWQAHLIEGLPGKRFALYFKVHHALVDGVGGIKMIREMLTPDRNGRLLDCPQSKHTSRHHDKESLSDLVKHSIDAILRQSQAVSEASGMLANMGLDSLLGKKDRPQVPFSAPRTLFNNELGTRRRFVICELPIDGLHAIGKHFGGTINDVLVSICGSALRSYLLELDALPERSLDAGLPVSIKGANASEGNQLSFIICPFVTDEADASKRLKRVIKITKKAKNDLAHISAAGSENLATMTMIPFLMVSLTHSSQRVPPVFNAIVSNVPGAKNKLYLEGAELESLYPLSVVTDGMGLNITAISYNGKLCLGITAAPASEPHIECLNDKIRKGFDELNSALEKAEKNKELCV